MSLDRVKIISEMATAWLGIIAIWCGGGFAVFQYFSQQEDGRIKETLIIFDQYSKPPLHDSKMAILTAWDKRQTQLDAALADPFSEQIYRQTVLKIIKEEKIVHHMFVLISFFDALEICVKENICETKVALMLFHQDACAFYHLHFSKIAEERRLRNEPFLAKQLEKFVSRQACPSSSP